MIVKSMGEMSNRDLENRIKTMEARLGKLELEMQNQTMKSLTDLFSMYQEHSVSLDQITLIMNKLVQEVFPKKENPKFSINGRTQ
jgi:TolA-binding protein